MLLTNSYKCTPYQTCIIMSSDRFNLNCSRPRLQTHYLHPLPDLTQIGLYLYYSPYCDRNKAVFLLIMLSLEGYQNAS